jgi:hypothetical protein
LETVEVSRLVLALFAVAVPAFAAGSFTTPAPVIYSRSNSQTALDDAGDNAGDNEVDVFGNEVSSAVAEYSLDATGELYERHSPQTEVPHLGSPKS